MLTTHSNRMPLTSLRRAAGLLAFYLSLYKTGVFVLCPLYNRSHCGTALPSTWASLTSAVWLIVPHTLPVVLPSPLCSAYSDATPLALGLFLPDFSATVFTPPTSIFDNELWAFLLLLFCAPSRALCFSGNDAVVYGVRTGHVHHLPCSTGLAVFALVVCKQLKIKWISTLDKPAEPLSRPHTYSHFPARRPAVGIKGASCPDPLV